MSGAINTKGLNVWMTEPDKSVTKTPTAAVAGQTTVVTIGAGNMAGATVGSMVYFNGTGMPSLDGKYTVISEIDAGPGTVTVLADTTGETFVAATPTMDVWTAADMVKLCLSNITLNPEAPGTVNVGTYCDPTATLPSAQVNAGTATLDGYVDPSDPGYPAILDAVADNAKRWIIVELPQEYGDIIIPITLSTVSWGLPIDGAVSFTINGVLASAAKHVFDTTP